MKEKFIAAYKNPSNWKPFILTAILARGILWLYFGHLVTVHVDPSNTIEKYFVRDDYIYFFTPVDNYFNTGMYSYLKGIPFTGRMPGYAIVYYLFRLISSQRIALFGVIGFQFLLSSISVYVLSLTAYFLFKNNKRCFYLTFVLYLFAVFPGFFDFFIIAESLSVSSLIFCVYYFVKYLVVDEKNKYLMLSGFFLTWTIFLREYTGLILLIFPLILIFYLLRIKRKNLFKTFRIALLFCLPFICCEGAWVLRNYIVTKKVILLESPMDEAYGNLYMKSWEALDNLVFTWGENASPFDKTTLGYYYRESKEPISPKFPAHIFNGVTTYNADSLVKLRKLYADCFFNKSDSAKMKLDSEIVALCTLYKNDYVSHNPFHYWVIKPIKDLKYFILFSGTGYLPLPSFSSCTATEKLIKIPFCILYYFILITGALGILLNFLTTKPNTPFTWMILLVCTSITFTIVFYSEIEEPRYFVHVFALLFLYSAYLTDQVLIALKKRANN